MVYRLRVRHATSYVVQREKGRTHFGLYKPENWHNYVPDVHTLQLTMRIYNGQQDRRSQ
jgi:hypothetical protein